MGKYLDMLETITEEKNPETAIYQPDQTDERGENGLSSDSSGQRTAISGKKLEMAARIISKCIDGLPTTVEEVTSCLYAPWDEHAEMFVNGDFDHEILRQTVASWLLFGRRDIYPMQYDAAEKLMRMEQYRQGCRS